MDAPITADGSDPCYPEKRYPFFTDAILRDLFIEDLCFCRSLKDFRLIGCAVNPDHVHLLIRPDGGAHYSEIMGSLKRNFARDCNDLMMGNGFVRNAPRRRGF